MRDDFCAFILTHGRPDRVHTYNALARAGYTGKVFIVIDDEDEAADEYVRRFGDNVIRFCKSEMAARIDEGNNSDDRRAIVYARNACCELARQVGCTYYMQLDDDYKGFEYRFSSCGDKGYIAMLKTFDAMVESLINFYEATPCLSVAVAQGGDYIGGQKVRKKLLRKCMNSWVCSVDRPFAFFGLMNEDVSTCVTLSRQGGLFFTVVPVKLVQLQTQKNAGGMTDAYIDGGTYIKTFYSVMYAPSCVKVGHLRDPRAENSRIHHSINWEAAAPKILSSEWKRGRVCNG